MSIRHMTAVWSSKIADPQAKMVLLRLADCADKDGVCWPSLSAIANDTELHRSTVCRKIETLESLGWIKRTRVRNACEYMVFMTPNQSQGATALESQPVAGCDHLNDETSRRVRLVAESDQSQGATQLVAGCDSTSRRVRLSNNREPSLTVSEPSSRAKTDLSDFDEPQEAKPPCTPQQAASFGATLKISPQACDFWWHSRNAAGWMRSSASGHPRKITSWQSDLSTSRAWAEEEADKARQSENKTNGHSVVIGGRTYKP